MDNFARIAQQKIKARENLVEVKPKAFDEVTVLLEKSSGEPTAVQKKADTKAELDALLKEERAKYAPFLRELAPSIKNTRSRIRINEFSCDGEKVTVPHYGAPVGNAKKTYVTTFTVPEKKADKLYFLHFSGVDYIAVVTLNGEFLGRHEGFFSPFEFDSTAVLRAGDNELKVEVYNDYKYGGNDGPDGISREGDKLYAATGLGWDGAYDGWHHCPPGMGIYGAVYLEERPSSFISDLFVRPLPAEEKAEIWVEAYNGSYTARSFTFSVSVFGKNFECEVVRGAKYATVTADFDHILPEGEQGTKLVSHKGENLFKITVEMPNARLWQLDAPYLYEAQITLIEGENELDCRKVGFGMRSFEQDNESEKKGAFYLNGKRIKLRGANTMGFEQQDVLRGDFEQLIDDILLAKLCNMNFLRLTQRPVQDEIYEYCDKLGLMVQTDLPLFGVMRRTKFAEGVRQAEEMEKMVRPHACNALVSLINEPFANAHNRPHRYLLRNELSDFFDSCEHIIRLNNPDRVIKFVDGDYDPPSDNMPDNHCYDLWYNGHCIDVGKLIKGYWCAVKPDWYYGCGEFGVEGLDFEEIMREYYPAEWLTEPFDPRKIVGAQTGDFYRFFYPRANSVTEWVQKSLRHQREAIEIMTEALRRNDDMVTFAIHLFIDAWPSGWMKTIMDFKRNPKPAFFAYRNALEPLTVSLRTDRFTYFEGEEIKIETHLLNDTNESRDLTVKYELIRKGKVVSRAEKSVRCHDTTAEYVCSPVFKVDGVNDREKVTLRALLVDGDTVITYKELEIKVFEDLGKSETAETVWVFPEAGEHEIAGEKVVVKELSPGAHFTEIVSGSVADGKFDPYDFRYFYDAEKGYITPIVNRTMKVSDGFKPVLLTANHEPTDIWTAWNTEVAVAEKEYEGKRYIVCTAELREENPVAKRFVDLMNAKRR